MKKTILTLVAVTVAVAAFAQGTINFNNSAAGALTKVYLPDGWTGGSNPGSTGPLTASIPQRNGNTATDSVVGTQTYTGALLQGSGWTVQLWSAPGSGAAENALAAQTTTTFRTGVAAAGRIAFTTGTLANVLPDAAVATLQLRVFPTSFGTWAAALNAFNLGDPAALIGKSNVFDQSAIGGISNLPAVMNNLQSFSLGLNVVPEPGTLALAGLGAASLLLFRRKK